MAELNGTEQFSNITLNGTSFVPYRSGSGPPKIVTVTTLSLLMILSLVGNSFFVAVFYRKKSLRTPVHYFIVNMAISDLIIPVVVLPWRITKAYHDGVWMVDGVLGSTLCKFVWVAWDVSLTVSILTMVVTAVERFHTDLFATKPVLISRRSCHFIIVVPWVFSVAFRAYYFYGVELVRYDTGLHCFLYTMEMLEIIDTSWLCLSFLSAIVLTVLYSSISLVLHQQKSNLNLASEVIRNRAKRNRVKRNRRFTRMLVIVVVVFYAESFPFNALLILLNFKPTIRLSCLFIRLVDALRILYPVVNPVVYYVLNEDYHRGFRELLCCPLPCNNKCKDCIHSSVSPLIGIDALNAGQANVTENSELNV